MLRGRLGSRRTERHLEDDVNVGAIPRFCRPFEVDTERTVSGSAPKDIIVVSPAEEYIAKGPSKGNSTACECVTEELISRIGQLLPLKVAGSLLAVIRDKVRHPGVRFMSRVFLRRGDEQLRHGIDLVAACFDLEKAQMAKEVRQGREERTFYTVELIDEVLAQTGRNEAERKSLRNGFASMIAFDALVGTNDRHSENWGIIENVKLKGERLRFAPVYDTARGLFWNHSEEQLEERISSSKERAHLIDAYANGSRPLITTGRDTDSHFDVVRGVIKSHPELGRSVRRIISAYNHQKVMAMMHTSFGRIMSRFRLELIAELLLFRHEKLTKIIRVI